MELIRKISLKQGLVISTGGGMIENPTIMKYLKYNSKIIYLEREINDCLFDGSRPKLKNIEDYIALENIRLPLYQKYADITFKNDDQSNVIVERIIDKL